jgi:hypothetical protein
MNCKRCNNKGYTESTNLRGGFEYPLTMICTNPDCEHKQGYSDRIKEKFGEQEETQQEKINRLTGRS